MKLELTKEAYKDGIYFYQINIFKDNHFYDGYWGLPARSFSNIISPKVSIFLTLLEADEWGDSVENRLMGRVFGGFMRVVKLPSPTVDYPPGVTWFGYILIFEELSFMCLIPPDERDSPKLTLLLSLIRLKKKIEKLK